LDPALLAWKKASRGSLNHGRSRWLKHWDFLNCGQPASQEKVCDKALTLAFYRRLARRKGFNPIWQCQGEAANLIKVWFAKILAGPNSKSIAPQGDCAIKNVGRRCYRLARLGRFSFLQRTVSEEAVNPPKVPEIKLSRHLFSWTWAIYLAQNAKRQGVFHGDQSVEKPQRKREKIWRGNWGCMRSQLPWSCP
jgi:hypothetical protein